jgi:hypothetical protein
MDVPFLELASSIIQGLDGLVLQREINLTSFSGRQWKTNAPSSRCLLSTSIDRMPNRFWALSNMLSDHDSASPLNARDIWKVALVAN